MRIGIAALSLALAGTLLLPAAAQAGTTARINIAPRTTHAAAPSGTDISAQRRVDRRPPTRLRVYPRYVPDPDGVYPRYYPGRNAVRDCTATYAQEFRPSGTVIVPRMNCFWRRG